MLTMCTNLQRLLTAALEDLVLQMELQFTMLLGIFAITLNNFISSGGLYWRRNS